MPVEIGYSVEDIGALRSEDTSNLVDGFMLFVRSIQDSQHGAFYTYWTGYTIVTGEGGIFVTDIGASIGTILIRPDSGEGYWVAPVGHTHLSSVAPPSNFGGAPVGVCHWLQSLSSPSRRVFWTWVPAITAWIKSGPPVVASGAPTFTPDFTGQRYVNSSTGDDYYHNGTSWVLAGSGGGGGSYTDEDAQDAVGGILADSSSINFTYTDSPAEITATAIFGTTSGTVCQGNDSRLSDARTPTAHTHTTSDITNFTSAVNALIAAGGGGGGGSGELAFTHIIQKDAAWQYSWNVGPVQQGLMWNSNALGDTGTGTFKLGWLTLENTLYLFVAGGGGSNGSQKVINFRRLSDDTIALTTHMGTLLGLNTDVMTSVTLDTSSAAGETVYLECIDSDSSASWGWFGFCPLVFTQ